MITRREFLRNTSRVVGGSLLIGACTGSNAAPAATEGTASSTGKEITNPTTPLTDTKIGPTTTGDESTPDPTARWAGADFDELDEFLSDTAGESFAIADHGELVHEWYRTDPSHIQDAASAQKSILSLLIGRAIADEAFALDTRIDDLLGPGWTPHGQSAAITVEHLLTMTSGLDDGLAVVAEPGTTWIYSGVWEQLFEVLTTTTGRDLLCSIGRSPAWTTNG